jgi:hypothetical protein
MIDSLDLNLLFRVSLLEVDQLRLVLFDLEMVLFLSLRELHVQALNLRFVHFLHFNDLGFQFTDLNSVLLGVGCSLYGLNFVHVSCFKLNALLLKEINLIFILDIML